MKRINKFASRRKMIFILHEMQIIKRYGMKIDLSFPPHIEFIFHD